jgi:2-methylcitrate dehydratase PrpD
MQMGAEKPGGAAAAPASLRLARHVAGLAPGALPGAAIVAAKLFLLDTLGVGVAGSSAPGAREVAAAAAGWGEGREATLWGRRDRAPAPAAAFVNGFAAHCQEYDCLHEGAVLHPMATLVPAALAWAERAGGVSGPLFLAALAGGVDVAVGLGLASRSPLRFFRPATAGGFGAAAAIGRLAGFAPERLADAFGLLYAQTSGTMQPHLEGSVALPLQIAFNARAALAACDLAALGLSGPRETIEGPFGYLVLFEGEWDLGPVWRDLGRLWRVTELSHKPYPSGRATHGGIEGVAALRAAHGFAAGDVARIIVRGPPLVVRLCGRPALPDPSPSYARLCMGFAIAKLLLRGEPDATHYRGAELRDPETYDLARRVVTESDGSADPNALVPQEVVVVLNDGRRLGWRCEQVLAHPSRPLTRARHLAKFRRCWSLADEPLGPAEAMIEIVEHLEEMDDMKRLAVLLAP